MFALGRRMNSRSIKLGLAALSVLAATSVAGCSANVDDLDAEDEALTSLTARSRSLRFDGYVYVDANASESTILSAVRAQTQTAFGALRTSEISVNSRELKDVDPKTFKKTTVTVADPTIPKTSLTPLATSVSTNASDGVIRSVFAAIAVSPAQRKPIVGSSRCGTNEDSLLCLCPSRGPRSLRIKPDR